MNLWPFKELPSFNHVCPCCGQHMIKPSIGVAYCVYAMCAEGSVNHDQFTGVKE